MGYLLLNTEEELSSRLHNSRRETVTLLVPEETWIRYGEEKARRLPKKIPELLRTYAKFLTATRRLGKKAGTTLYQPYSGRAADALPGSSSSSSSGGLGDGSGKTKMRRINVRLGTGSWTLLGALAQAHGVSRCYLFNYLLYLEESEVGDSIEEMMNEGVPTFHKNYSYILHLDLTFNRVTRRLQCLPESAFYTFEYREWFRELE